VPARIFRHRASSRKPIDKTKPPELQSSGGSIESVKEGIFE
jgi:hypothetical protein